MCYDYRLQQVSRLNVPKLSSGCGSFCALLMANRSNVELFLSTISYARR